MNLRKSVLARLVFGWCIYFFKSKFGLVLEKYKYSSNNKKINHCFFDTFMNFDHERKYLQKTNQTTELLIRYVLGGG